MGGRLVLLGAGHAHVEVLRRFAADPLPGATMAVVSPKRRVPYTGMAPGYVSGRYGFDEISIDVGALAAKAGARLALTIAETVDRAANVVICDNGDRLAYDVLSIDVGAIVRTPFPVAPGAPPIFGVKPAEPFLEMLDAFLSERLSPTTAPSIAIVGGGYGGIELSAALARRGAGIRLVAGRAGLAPTAPEKARRRIARQLARRGVEIIAGVNATGAGEGALVLDDGRRIVADLIVLAIGVSPPDLIEGLDLPKDGSGFLAVDPTLASSADPTVFAVGDCAGFARPKTGAPLPKAGVYAVRQGPILAANLRAALLGSPLAEYNPQADALSILTFHPAGAIAVKGAFAIGGQCGGQCSGRWVDAWKTWIDRRFIARYD